MDLDLVRSARRGDEAAFVDLIAGRVDRLYAIASRIVRDPDRAQDALQEALVVAWRQLPALRDDDRFDAWLQRIVVRECIDQSSRERRRIAGIIALPADGLAGPDELLNLAHRDQLERGFRRLPPDQRAILVLHHFEGYSPAEIATVLGIPAGTARSRLHHAHRAMRAALDAEARLASPKGRTA